MRFQETPRPLDYYVFADFFISLFVLKVINTCLNIRKLNKKKATGLHLGHPQSCAAPRGGDREAGDRCARPSRGWAAGRGRPLARLAPTRGGLVRGLMHVHRVHHRMMERTRASNYEPLQRHAPSARP